MNWSPTIKLTSNNFNHLEIIFVNLKTQNLSIKCCKVLLYWEKLEICESWKFFSFHKRFLLLSLSDYWMWLISNLKICVIFVFGVLMIPSGSTFYPGWCCLSIWVCVFNFIWINFHWRISYIISRCLIYCYHLAYLIFNFLPKLYVVVFSFPLIFASLHDLYAWFDLFMTSSSLQTFHSPRGKKHFFVNIYHWWLCLIDFSHLSSFKIFMHL